MSGYVFHLSSTYGFALLDGTRCGCCGRDASAPGGRLFRELRGEDGSDLLGPELRHYADEAAEAWSGGSRVPVEGLAGFRPVAVEGRGYAFCENCEAVLLEREGGDGPH